MSINGCNQSLNLRLSKHFEYSRESSWCSKLPKFRIFWWNFPCCEIHDPDKFSVDDMQKALWALICKFMFWVPRVCFQFSMPQTALDTKKCLSNATFERRWCGSTAWDLVRNLYMVKNIQYYSANCWFRTSINPQSAISLILLC